MFEIKFNCDRTDELTAKDSPKRTALILKQLPKMLQLFMQIQIHV